MGATGSTERRADPPIGKGRVLGLDLGDVRIGVAISDHDRRMAVPLGTVRTGAPQDLRSIANLVREHSISVVVVGHPLAMSGEAGTRARSAQEFAGALRSFLEVPVVLHDERLSTVEAERSLKRTGVAGRERRQKVDQAAAAIILQAWLDAHGRSRRGPSREDEL